MTRRCGLQQLDGIGMLRHLIELRPCPHFNDFPRIHYGNPVCHIRHDCQIVRNQQHCHLELLLKALDKFQNLCLDGDIERGCGFIGDEQTRLTRECHRNHDALFHAAGHLMRILIVTRRGFRNPHLFQHLNRCVSGGSAAEVLMQADCFRNLVTYCENGIETCHRFLKNHSDVVALNLPFFDSGEARDVLSFEINSTTGDKPCRLRHELDKRKRGDAFPAARFADEREDFVLPELKSDTVYCTCHSFRRAKIGSEGLDAEQWFVHKISITCAL